MAPADQVTLGRGRPFVAHFGAAGTHQHGPTVSVRLGGYATAEEAVGALDTLSEYSRQLDSEAGVEPPLKALVMAKLCESFALDAAHQPNGETQHDPARGVD